MSSQNTLNTALQRLSSGLRINSAKDDAAGLAIASRMGAQVSGLNQAIRNANDAVSLSQTADGALGTSSDILGRIRDLAVQAANDTNSGTDRAALQQEVGQLQQELNRVANETEFNGKKLLDGSFIAQQFQVGANANQTIAISMTSAKAGDIGNQAFNSDGTALQGMTAAGSIPTTNNVAAQTVTVSGSVGSKAITLVGGESAKTISDAVNADSASTGVTATARTQVELTASAAGTFTFNLQGSNTSSPAAISVQVTNPADLSKVADAINAKAGQTGITATALGGKITMTSETGDDIGIGDVLETGGSGATLSAQAVDYDGSGAFSPTAVVLGGATTTDSTLFTGRLSFASSNAYTVSTDTAGSLLTTGTNASALDAVSTIDVTSQAGANDAISVIDGAMDFINGSRAQLGAVENRVESTISNLSATSENLSAAQSRIQDTDFAAETAQLTRSQVLQQAGTAMLAQANALPNQVLTLLR